MSKEKRLNREDILRIVSELDFFGGEDCWLTSGASLVLFGVKDSTRDVDVICTRALADRLEARGVPFRRDGLDNTRIFAFNSLVEVLVRAQKAALGREKDLADMALIDAFLERKEAGK